MNHPLNLRSLAWQHLCLLFLLLGLSACSPRTVAPVREGVGRPGYGPEGLPFFDQRSLAGRGVRHSAPLQDTSAKTGTVVVELCVNRRGKVLSAAYTPKGSTTADEQLVQLAVNNALEWRFARGKEKKQCGTITFNFRHK